MGQWWVGPHFDWDCLVEHILGSLLTLWSLFQTPTLDLRGSVDLFAPLPSVVVLDESPLFGFPLFIRLL